MKDFFRKLLFFLILPTLIILSLDIFHRTRITLYDEKYKGALKFKDKVEILILGNSHANYGVDPTQFEKFTYNVASPNQSLYFDKRITLKLLDHLPNLKFVLISIDYHSLYFSSQRQRDIWSYYSNGIKYKQKNYFFEKLSPTLFGYAPKVTFSIIKRRIKNWIEFGRSANPVYLQKGVNPLDSVKNGFIGYEGQLISSFDKNNYIERVKILSAKEEESNGIVNDLEGFIKTLKKGGVEPIFFTAPTYSEFNKYLDFTRIKLNQQSITELTQKYDIKYLDFSDSTLFNKKDFYDEDHLNKIGAKKFGLLLSDTINKTFNPKATSMITIKQND